MTKQDILIKKLYIAQKKKDKKAIKFYKNKLCKLLKI